MISAGSMSGALRSIRRRPVALAVAATVVCVAVCAVVLVLADHGRACLWQDAALAIGYALVFQVLNLLLGVAFGLLFRSTPVAIVVYFAAPTAWSILTPTWAQVGTATAVWIVLPMLAGSWRVLYRPVGA
jgi:hypothetical protein